MRVYQIILIAVLVGTAVPIALHHQVRGVYDADHIAMSFFLWLNAIIAFWEMCLFFGIEQIERQHAEFVPRYKGRELDRVKDYFGMHVPLGKLLSPAVWAELWASYSVFDDSYANRKSFGFFIDIGNGFSTFIPTLVCLYCMTYEFLSARTLGVVLLLLNYQMWYGTLIYFTSFIFNKRHEGHTRFNLYLFVGFTNGLWFTFPVWGMWCAMRLIYSNTYAVFGG